MISHDQLDKALKRIGLNLQPSQVNTLMNDLLPNPQSAMSVGGVTVWGDRQSIQQVEKWHHNDATVETLRQRVNTAERIQPFAVKCLDFVLRVSAENPAHVGTYRNLAVQFLHDHGIKEREGFFTTQDAGLADARIKLNGARL